ncbi:PilW family protein [Tumebacillus permanentifrigoris]|uniref:Prepilin-type N-terminal cleavage/methylation domain-containing protein n=1 Tax=Tumebacillus permanentifrigoris TaxID=378543 RepID=A0A316D532_9BACL|nr:type II secretion system protein [Tumebacillus permanentifrigoris]PWK06253.1 prepilin-type N-terminal cleavage/methylation domain-containing protein [Tumebacillus permanentifrigoris]
MLGKGPHANERGVTMIELLVVLALMGLVFGAVAAFSTSTMTNFYRTSQGSLNQQEATLIVSQLTQDLRRLDPTVQWVESADHKFHLRTARANDVNQEWIEVAYEQDGSRVLYSTGDNVTVTLTEHGQVDVKQTGDTFDVTVTVGADDDPNQAKLTTTVARYNWGR